jgi:hypothetical protein
VAEQNGSKCPDNYWLHTECACAVRLSYSAPTHTQKTNQTKNQIKSNSISYEKLNHIKNQLLWPVQRVSAEAPPEPDNQP